VVRYEALGRVAPSPVVELNRSVAVAMASGPEQALAIVDDLIASDRLPGSHLVLANTSHAHRRLRGRSVSMPPSTASVTPVTDPAAGEAR
jgi:predicted RNA polymerase sigma factor